MKLKSLQTSIANWSVKTHLIIGVTLVHAFLMLAFIWGHLISEFDFLVEQLNHQAIIHCKHLSTSSAPWVLSQDWAGLEEIMQTQKNNKDHLYSMITTREGLVLAHTENKYVGQYVADPNSQNLLTGQVEAQILTQDSNKIETASPIYMGSKHIGWARVALSRVAIQSQINHELGSGILFAIMAMLVGAAMAWWISNLLTQQLSQLARVADLFRQGNRLSRAEENSQNEVGRLAAGFNRMLDKLDIDEQNLKLSEQKIKVSEERLKIALNRTTDGLWDLNLINLKIHYSENWLAMMGYKESELKNDYSEFLKLIHTEDFETRERIFEDHIRGILTQFECIYRLRHRTGRYIWLEEKAQLILDDVLKPCRFISTSLNITEKKEMAAEKEMLVTQMQRTQKMEAIGQLTSGLAHDFNNILSGVMGYTDLITKRCEIDNNAKNYFNKIIESTNRAKLLVNQMVNFSTAKSDGQENIFINDVLANEMLMMRELFDSQILIENHFTDEKMIVSISKTELEQSILNLCLNARDAIDPQQGKITVSLKKSAGIRDVCASCGSSIIGEWVTVTISDNGHGINAEIFKDIFNPFFTTKPVGKGSGMGLAVVHGIVHRNGGHVQVQSTTEGSQFSIHLPLAKIENQILPILEKKPKMQNVGPKKYRILVVDDEQIIREMIHELFFQFGYDVAIASNGLEAYHIIKEQKVPFDVMITDLSMPIMNGEKLIVETRKLYPDLPIIVITGNLVVDQDSMLKNLKISEVLFKPFDLNNLKNVVNHQIKIHHATGIKYLNTN
jgi:PAS domain S-box-containing protein